MAERLIRISEEEVEDWGYHFRMGDGEGLDEVLVERFEAGITEEEARALVGQMPRFGWPTCDTPEQGREYQRVSYDAKCKLRDAFVPNPIQRGEGG